MTDEQWQKALNSACHQFEIYVRQDKLKTPEERRKALDDSLQRAIGLIRLWEKE